MGPVQYTVLVNQTAIHGVPTALNAVNQALLRAWTGAPDASIRLVNNPLPMVLGEDALVVNQMSGELLIHVQSGVQYDLWHRALCGIVPPSFQTCSSIPIWLAGSSSITQQVLSPESITQIVSSGLAWQPDRVDCR